MNSSMLDSLEAVIRAAGDITLKHFKSPSAYEVKEDKSPMTIADTESNAYLTESLKTILPIPVLSEEEEIPYDTRRNWSEFWLIDPLDGTKDFIKNLDDFCINIALVRNGKPVLGLIYAPALDELYMAQEGKGVQYKGKPLPPRKNPTLTAVLSRFHHSERTQEFLTLNSIERTVTVGASLKFGRMALGQIDIYPRFEGSKEWDTGAGQIILKESGCCILDLVTKNEPIYNKPSLKNNYFLAYCSSVDINQIIWPQLIEYST